MDGAAVDDGGGEERKRPPRSKVLEHAREEDIADVLAWVGSQAPDATFRIRVDRKAPVMGPNGENLVGHLDVIEERPDDLMAYLRQRWGGGSYQLKVEVPNRNGGWQYAKAATVKVSGEPKLEARLHGRGAAEAVTAPAGDPLADRAISSAERFAEITAQRADRLEQELARSRSQGPDQTLVTTLMAQVADLNARLVQMATKEPPRDDLRDRMLQQAMGGESQRVTDLQRAYEARLDKMRDDHAAELRMLRENHTADAKRSEDRHDKAMDEARRAHDRTITALEKSKDDALREMREAHARELRQGEKGDALAMKTLESSHQAQLTAMAAENKRLSADNAELKSQIGALRAVKEKPADQQLKELVSLKQSMDELTGGGGEDGEKKWYTQLMEVVGNSEAVVSLVERIGGKGEAQAGAAPAAAPPAQRPQPAEPAIGSFVRHQGRIHKYLGNGQLSGPLDETKVKRLAQQRARQAMQQAHAPAVVPAAAAAPGQVPTEEAIDAAIEAMANGSLDDGMPQPLEQPAPPQPVVPPPAVQPTEEDVKNAVVFMEAAFQSGQKPENFARTVRSAVSGATIQFIGNIGADRFLDAIAQVKRGSPLVTQSGRTFVRAVAAALFGPQS